MKKILLVLLCLTINLTVQASIDVEYNDGIYHAVLKGDDIKEQLKFVSTSGLMTNREAHNNAKSKFTINAGFFDPKNEKTISGVDISASLFSKGLTVIPCVNPDGVEIVK